MARAGKALGRAVTVTFKEALEYAATRKVVESKEMSYGAEHADGDTELYAEFEDGSRLIIITDHSGPYSEVTPDVDFHVGIYIQGPSEEDRRESIP